MRGTTRTVAVAVMSAAALLAAGCGGGDSSSGDGSTAAGKTGGEITIRGCNPENPLIPSNTTETCGGNIIDAFAAPPEGPRRLAALRKAFFVANEDRLKKNLET